MVENETRKNQEIAELFRNSKRTGGKNHSRRGI